MPWNTLATAHCICPRSAAIRMTFTTQGRNLCEARPSLEEGRDDATLVPRLQSSFLAKSRSTALSCLGDAGSNGIHAWPPGLEGAPSLGVDAMEHLHECEIMASVPPVHCIARSWEWEIPVVWLWCPKKHDDCSNAGLQRLLVSRSLQSSCPSLAMCLELCPHQHTRLHCGPMREARR